MPSPKPEASLGAPRILCLHGGGVTGEIFRMQARALTNQLKTRFRFIWVDAPFLCDPGPGIVPVYQDYGPFRRWLRWLPEHPECDAGTVISEIKYQIETTIEADPGNGPIVAVMGFSQGAKLAASLLYQQQLEEDILGMAHSDYKFGILLAGRTPLMKMSGLSDDKTSMLTCDEVSEGFNAPGDLYDAQVIIPTIHVHGSRDAGLHLHQRMMNKYCDKKTTMLVEWDGDHRVPFKKADVEKLVAAINMVADREGVPG